MPSECAEVAFLSCLPLIAIQSPFQLFCTPFFKKNYLLEHVPQFFLKHELQTSCQWSFQLDKTLLRKDMRLKANRDIFHVLAIQHVPWHVPENVAVKPAKRVADICLLLSSPIKRSFVVRKYHNWRGTMSLDGRRKEFGSRIF